MASSSVPTVPTKAPKKSLKRIMLAKAEEQFSEIDTKTQDEIVSSVCHYVRSFKDRKDLDRAIMLGFNTISRKAEQCDENLKIVLLNAHLKPEMMLTNLHKLCVLKKIPVGRLDNFREIAEAMLPLVKGLKATFTAFGVLGASPEEFRAGIIEKLPPVVIPEEPAPVKRARLSPTPFPRVDVQQFYIKLSECPSMSQVSAVSSSAAPSAETLSFSEGKIPMVDYGTFIGSDRQIESASPTVDDDKPRQEPSKYKQPVMAIR